jgi:hypothetical protein
MLGNIITDSVGGLGKPAWRAIVLILAVVG